MNLEHVMSMHRVSCVNNISCSFIPIFFKLCKYLVLSWSDVHAFHIYSPEVNVSLLFLCCALRRHFSAGVCNS